MELPEIGENCNEPSCNKLDFLPVKCDACNKIFCSEHMNYEKHNCTSAYKKDVQVPVCPLCGLPVPTPKNQKPDVTVSEHMDNQCKADSMRPKKKFTSNRCSVPGCKIKEMIPIVCRQCNKNFCLLHRFPDVHFCSTQRKPPIKKTHMSEHEENSPHIRAVHGLLSEDEALAKALSESMKDADRFYAQDEANQTSVNSINSQRCQVS